ncbi:MAG: type VI secretion system tip protein VgrG, partial [Polyangiaceae bacterium]|nr:type VI secretion system tip protein VgrG [Polyangiaceae bacterium]
MTSVTPRQFDLALGELEPDSLAVASFSGTEHVGRPFRFAVTFGADPTVVGPPAALLGAPARLVLQDGRGEARRIQGIVSRLMLRAVEANGLAWYEVELVPRFSLGRRRRNSRVFQEQSVPDIAAVLFEEHGVRFEQRLLRRYEPRTYCVEYQETDFAFVTRLLSEEGIFYWFEDPPEGSGLDVGELLVISDTPAGYRDVEADAVLHFRGATGLREAAATVEGFAGEVTLAPDAAEVRAFDFLRPELALRQQARDEGAGPGRRPASRRARGVPLEMYDYRYDIEEAELSSWRAGSLLEGLR